MSCPACGYVLDPTGTCPVCWPPEGDGLPVVARRRPCSHPRRDRAALPDGGWRCGRCGHEASGDVVRRGRRARRLGSTKERAVMDRAGLRTVGWAGGPADGLGERFIAQSKAYAPGRYPGWALREIEALVGGAGSTDLAAVVSAVGAGRLPVLIVSENPGRGRKARDPLVIMRLDDWVEATRQGNRDAR